MDFALVLSRLRTFLESRDRPWALIGGLAMAAYGLPRTTLDLDLVAQEEAQEELVSFLEEELGYETVHRSRGYSNHEHRDLVFGSVDVVYVGAVTAKKLFGRVREIVGPGDEPVPVPSPEHMAAMKVVAMKNDPGRTFQELGDIRHLLSAAGASREEVRSYFARHGLEHRYRELEETL